MANVAGVSHLLIENKAEKERLSLAQEQNSKEQMTCTKNKLDLENKLLVLQEANEKVETEGVHEVHNLCQKQEICARTNKRFVSHIVKCTFT